MPRSNRDSPSIDQPDQVLLELFDEITRKLEAGEPLDIDRYRSEHPDHFEQIQQVLPTLEAIVELGYSTPDGESSRAENRRQTHPLERLGGVLGDFRIIREIGRGGMGVVYEAEQLSLRRRVALKVLPFAATLDSRQLQRFKNEALAAASLEHPSIVRVHSVGCERGVHYYAMQFVEGQTLAEVIDELRSVTDPSSSEVERESVSQIRPRPDSGRTPDRRSIRG